MDFNIPYLRNNCLPYLGNKEGNLKFLSEQIDKIITQDKTLQNKLISFVDLFSGSGIVSRLARIKGFRVIANDLEIYSKIVTEVPIKYTQNQVKQIFSPITEKLGLTVLEGSDAYLTTVNYLNELKRVKYPKNNYFSLNFAPKNTKNIDKQHERLFYTQENASKIDAIIETIFNNRLFSKEAKDIILASLVVSILNVINNEKRVTRSFLPKFKARDERVLSEMMLEPFSFLSEEMLMKMNPALLEENNQCESHRGYAEIFMDKVAKGEEFDFVYLDPPFQQQQYSFNYSHLISACENDKQEVESVEVKKFHSRPVEELNESKFCKKAKSRGEKLAEISLRRTFESINAKYILFSHCANTVLTIPEIIKIFSDGGKNSISVAFEFSDSDEIDIQKQHKVEHTLFVIKKNDWQSKEDVALLIRELQSKSVMAENESLAINNKLIDIFALVDQNSDWYYIENNVLEKYRLYHNDTFLFEVDFNLNIKGNIDADFSKEQIAIIGAHFISEKQAKSILAAKEESVLPSFKNSETTQDNQEDEDKLPSFLDSIVVKEDKKEEANDTVDGLMALLEKNLTKGNLSATQKEGLRSLIADVNSSSF